MKNNYSIREKMIKNLKILNIIFVVLIIILVYSNIRINRKVIELEKTIETLDDEVYDISLKVKKQPSYWLCHKCGCLNVSYDYDDEWIQKDYCEHCGQSVIENMKSIPWWDEHPHHIDNGWKIYD